MFTAFLSLPIAFALTVSTFSDVSENHPNFTAINYLKTNNIINGYPDGTFQPDKNLNRAELLKITINTGKFPIDDTQYQNCFPDVTTDWFSKYVCFAKEKSWIKGYNDGNFKPDKEISRAETIKILLEVFYVTLDTSTASAFNDIKESDWFFNYINTAQNLGILATDENQYYPQTLISRGEVSENIYRLINNEDERYQHAFKDYICQMYYYDQENYNKYLEFLDCMFEPETPACTELKQQIDEDTKALEINAYLKYSFPGENETKMNEIRERHTRHIPTESPETFCPQLSEEYN